MNWAEIRKGAWERTGPVFTGLTWSIPVALWMALAVGGLPADTRGIELSLLVPVAACLIPILLLEKRLTWPGRIVSAVLGIMPAVFLVFGTLPGWPVVISALELVTVLAWGALIVSIGIGHIAPARALAGRSLGVRLAPLSAWLTVACLWVVVQASPDSALAQGGSVLEIQMATIAGIAGLGVLLVSAIADRIPALRRHTTRAGRLR